MKKFLFLMILLGLINTNSYAFNFSFLDGSPVSYFTDADWKIFDDTIVKAIKKPDGTKTSWNNVETGAKGYFIPSKTKIEKGLLCKILLIFNEARDRTELSHYKICKMKDGWKEV